MMAKDPEQRYDIKQVLQHPFVVKKHNSKNLDIALQKLKKYNQRLKLKASQIAVYWMNIIQKKNGK